MTNFNSSRETERAMNILGLTVGIDRNPSAKVRWTRRAVALLGANVVVLSGGLAYATWSASGTGSGTASAGSASLLTVEVTNVTGLYPKQQTTIPVKVTNTNPFPITLSTLTLSNVAATGSGCNNSDVALDSSVGTVSGNVFTPSSGTAIAKSGAAGDAATYNVPIAAADLANGCQGANHSFSLTFTAAAASS